MNMRPILIMVDENDEEIDWEPEQVPKTSDIIVEDESSDDSSEEDYCEHPQRDESGVCTKCGQWKTTVSVPGLVNGARRLPVRSIEKEIRGLPFNDDIKTRANAIFVSINSKGSKKKSRKMAVCYCLFQAHRQLGEAADPIMIGSAVGLNKSKVNKAITYYSSYGNTGYGGGVNSYVEPVDLILPYGKHLRLTDE